MAIYLSRIKQPQELLNNILGQPELPAIIQSLDASVLTRLVHHVGLEDSAEIVSLATVEQLKQVFDEDLWISVAPGQEEVFNADRFALWLEVMLEVGSEFAARKLLELDEDLVTLALCRLILVVEFDDLALRLSDVRRSLEDDLLDKVLDSTPSQEFDGYLVIAKRFASWETVRLLLSELNNLEYVTLNRLLERCCRITWEYIDDNGGLFNVLSAEEMLEEDLAADRETRREGKGFVSAATATAFLNLSRTTALNDIDAAKTEDPITQNYFKILDVAAAPRWTHAVPESPSFSSTGTSSAKVTKFMKMLQGAEVLPASDQRILSYAAESWDHHLPLAKAMRYVHRSDPVRYSRQVMELGYLSNILISGCAYRKRAFRLVEAAEAAFSVCNLGAELLGVVKGGKERDHLVESMANLVAERSMISLFQVGWKLLSDDVVHFSANALVAFFEGLKDDLDDPSEARETARLAEFLRSRIVNGMPWEFGDQLEHLYAYLDGSTIMTLSALLQSYPTMTEVLCKFGQHRTSPFISSQTHINTIRRFLSDVL